MFLPDACPTPSPTPDACVGPYHARTGPVTAKRTTACPPWQSRLLADVVSAESEHLAVAPDADPTLPSGGLYSYTRHGSRRRRYGASI